MNGHTEELCDFSMLPHSMCHHCIGEASPEKDGGEVISEMPAMYSSRLLCGHWVDMGDDIFKMETGEWICKSCSP